MTGLGNFIVNGLRGVIDQGARTIAGFLSGIPNAIISALSSIANNISNALNSTIGGVVGSISNTINKLTGFITSIPGSIAQTIQQLSTGLFNSLTGVFNSLTKTLADLPREIREALDRSGRALEQFSNDFGRSLDRDLIKPAQQAMAGLWNSFVGLIQNTIGGLLQSILPAASSPLTDPFGATIRALGGLVGLGASIGIPMTAAELIHPLKQIGLSRLAAYFWDLADFKTIGGTLLGTITSISIGAALRQGLNFIYRPTLPPLTQVDNMYFQGQVDLARWTELYKLSGWQDKDLNSWFNAMFTNPSQRVLIDLIGVEGIPEAWIKQKLIALGFSPPDVNIMLLYAFRRKIQDEVGSARTAILGGYVDGFITETEVRETLISLGYAEQEISWSLFAAGIRRTIARSKEKVTALKAAFSNRQITEAQLGAGLKEVVTDDAQVRNIVQIEVFRQKPAKETSVANERRLTASQLQTMFIRDVIDEGRLRAMLLEIRYAGDDLELLVTDARARKGRALAQGSI